jgi:hypothetical protein
MPMYEFEPAHIIDGKGNNAVVACPACKKPYLVPGQWNWKKPRPCPHCGQSEAICDKRGADAYKTVKLRPVPLPDH